MAQKALLRVLRSNLKRALRSGQVAEARSLLSQLRDEDPLSAETRGLELELLISLRHWDEANDLTEQLLTLFPSSARIHYLAGRVHYQRKDYARAQDHFAESNRVHPHWLARHWLGKTCVQRGAYEPAEALLVDLVASRPGVRLDLAWLYERREEPERALEQVEAYLAGHPDDVFARAQERRLRATLMAPGELKEEVDSLVELGETVGPEVIPAYVQRLLETGQGAAARRFVAAHEAEWRPRTVTSVAWICHRLQAYDLSVRLFLLALAEHTGDYKLLTALESAARHSGRIDDVAAAYEDLAPRHKKLYGRLRGLRKA